MQHRSGFRPARRAETFQHGNNTRLRLMNGVCIRELPLHTGARIGAEQSQRHVIHVKAAATVPEDTLQRKPDVPDARQTLVQPHTIQHVFHQHFGTGGRSCA